MSGRLSIALAAALLVWGAWPAPGQAQTCSPEGSCELSAPLLDQASPRPGAGRGVALFSLASSAAAVGGTIALLVKRDWADRQLTWGLWTAGVAVTVPTVAIGGWSSRRRGAVKGLPALRKAGLGAFTVALTDGVAQWLIVASGERPAPAITVLGGVVVLLAHAALGLDAFESWRQARVKLRYGAG